MARGKAALMLGAAVAITALSGAPAYAHADYRDSNPPDGGSVSSPPGEIWAEFTEQPVEGSTLVVADPCGRRVDNGDYNYQPYPINRITVSLSAEAAGGYVVTWTVTSNADGHTTRGEFSFVSESGAPCPSDEGSSSGSDGSDGGGNSARRTVSTEGGSEDPAASASEVAQSQGSSTAKQRSGKRGKDQRPAKTKRGDRAVVLSQSPARDEAPANERDEDIPLDWLVVGLSISALIGAAGGRIYVNIVAPRR